MKKELHLSLQKTEDGELVAVTYTDDEHRIVEVLWEKPLVKELTDEDCINHLYLAKNFLESTDVPRFKRILEAAIIKKPSEK